MKAAIIQEFPDAGRIHLLPHPRHGRASFFHFERAAIEPDDVCALFIN
ncbi:MAG TPA: hypothetical protein VF430_06110 [Verrucomicrobiae bacterium]